MDCFNYGILLIFSWLPDNRKSHLAPTPLTGGIAMFVAFTLGVALAGILDGTHLFILAGAGLLVAIGMIDDRRHIHFGMRLVAHGGRKRDIHTMIPRWLTSGVANRVIASRACFQVSCRKGHSGPAGSGRCPEIKALVLCQPSE